MKISHKSQPLDHSIALVVVFVVASLGIFAIMLMQSGSLS